MLYLKQICGDCEFRTGKSWQCNLEKVYNEKRNEKNIGVVFADFCSFNGSL